jgi:hypothetical protein
MRISWVFLHLTNQIIFPLNSWKQWNCCVKTIFFWTQSCPFSSCDVLLSPTENTNDRISKTFSIFFLGNQCHREKHLDTSNNFCFVNSTIPYTSSNSSQSEWWSERVIYFLSVQYCFSLCWTLSIRWRRKGEVRLLLMFLCQAEAPGVHGGWC